MSTRKIPDIEPIGSGIPIYGEIAKIPGPMPQLQIQEAPNKIQIDFSIIMELLSTKKNADSTQQYDINEDFKWYTSGKIDTEKFKDQYIAIWKKQIVANAKTAIDAKKLAKIVCGEDSRPAIVYVPKDENAIL